MPKNKKKNTDPGAVDDNATERAKKNEKDKQNQLRAIFDDNKTGRYGTESYDD